MPIILKILLLYFFLDEGYSANVKTAKVQNVPDNNADNPINNVYLKTQKGAEEHFAHISLKRYVNPDQVNIMKSPNPKDENSYIAHTDVRGDVDYKRRGMEMVVPLLSEREIDNKLVYSVQLVLGENTHQTEPFYFDQKEKIYKWLREKTTFWTPLNIGLIIAGLVIVAVIGAVIGYRFCRKKEY
ncbi:hypothetical protein SLOPH_722 [Spraguea lophii 42_110]|uniref:Uncharacterized protein n=1 Tax=Spraguea lophii (strain 42_110) TaxID=1358809 RepID=S7XKL8_SPRLO|nr:hypothetical protein SLOPH_722 [Spraguea lophii 42_110]